MKKGIILIVILLSALNAVQGQTLQQADSLHNCGRELFSKGKIIEGRAYTEQAMNIRKQLLGEVSNDYITSLNNYAFSYSLEKNNSKAIELQEKVIGLCRQLKEPHPMMGMFLANLGRYYFIADDYKKSAACLEEALPIVEKHGEIYEFILNALSTIYSTTENQEGLMRIMALAEEHNLLELEKPCDEPKCMLERAMYYSNNGNQAMAKECFLKALSMNLDDATKITVYEAYAGFLSVNAKDYLQGAEYYLSAANARKAVNGENKNYANTMHRAAVYFFLGKDYNQSIDIYKKIVDYYKSHSDEHSPQKIAECTIEIGKNYRGLKENGKAAECFKQVVEYYQQNDSTSNEYPKAILRLAIAEKFNNDYEPSIEHHKQAMAIFEKRGMANEYSEAAASLQTCYLYAGKHEIVDMRTDESDKARIERIDKIIHEELNGLEFTKVYLGKLMYARSLATLAGCYEMKRDYDKSVDYYQKYMDAVREAIRDEFRMQSERERMLVWENEKRSIASLLGLLNHILTETAAAEPLGEQLAAIAYDAELLQKGILLNSSIEFSKVLTAQGDASLKEAYEQTKENEKEIDRLRKAAKTDDELSRILSLIQQNQALQLQLYRGCAEYADFTDYISYSWKDVQQKLSEGDVAIEFAVVGKQWVASENTLVALVLTKDMKIPALVTVCDMKTLQQIQNNENFLRSPAVGEVIWGGLTRYLTNSKRIYFSADGPLTQMAIEYLPYNGEPLADKYEVYRLSSTKELCYRHRSTAPSKAFLFGDISYNNGGTTSDNAQRSIAAMRGQEGANQFSDLNNSLREVNGILETLKQNANLTVEKLTGTEASKNAFLQLTDSKVNIIHIATHGMYKATKKSTDAESMQNCFLAFAGANLDAGALVTAAEIADMNLRQCNLAVLSACETGLGKMGDDGVFGLQRGFKNAGVHSLLMSLKNVYDEATAELMLNFYKNLMNGDNKRKALIKAQQHLRDIGYEEPEFWAAFILLDAI